MTGTPCLIGLPDTRRASPKATAFRRITPNEERGELTLFAATLIQCYATRTGSGCAPLSVHATMVECRKLASEYQKFDRRDLRVKGVPAVVSYQCVAAKPGASR